MINVVYPILSKQTSLPFYLSGIGISDPEYHVVRDKGLVSHQFLVTTDGKGLLKINGEEHILEKGSIFYISPGIVHEYYPINNNWVTEWIVFRGKYIDTLMSDMKFNKFEIKNNSDNQMRKNIFSRLHESAQISTAYDRTSVILYEYILEMNNILYNSDNKNESHQRIINQAIEYIGNNLAKDISVEELANVTNVSIPHLCRVFKAELGMRPVEYINQTRINYAKSLLLNTNKSINEISQECGFSGQNYFGIVFRRLEGISPTEFKGRQNTFNS